MALRWLGIPWLIRRWAFRRGVRSQHDSVYFLAMLVVGRAAFLRRTARLRGVYGREPVWVAMAGLFFAKDTLDKLTKREVEYVATERLRAGDRVQISSIPPSGRRRRSTAS